MVNSDEDRPLTENIKFASMPLSKKNENLQQTPWQNRSSTYYALGFSLFLVFIVVFALPRFVPKIEKNEQVKENQILEKRSIKESPFIDAQLTKARRKSQDSLADFLAVQDFLEKRGVTKWGRDAFERALTIGANGDKLFRQRKFSEALVLYEEAKLKLNKLKNLIPNKLAMNLQIAKDALIRGDSKIAKEYYNLALSIDPSSIEALKGLARTDVLDEVLILLKKGEQLLESGDYKQARNLFVKANKLDPLNKIAMDMYSQATLLIQDIDFKQLMSNGYQALEAKNYSVALEKFQIAMKIKPQNQAAFLGSTQAQQLLAQKFITDELKKAELNEDMENWDDALEGYEKILNKSGILIEAQVGKKRTSSRLEISNDINNIILSPLRLSTPQVYDQAKKLLINAQKISNPGAKHLKQLSQLKQALEDSQVDLQVLFRSDRSTNVTLLKKGNLGYFIEKNLILKPGNYIATGTRDGYRDIRIEFRVSKESAPFNIEVTCKEQI
ncbi:MAG: hypothetical protein CMK44_06330 [Porticoccus sp.]|jgi:tetratricopeptide (TPR) repeat protein|nr:hypothetical protein [Porticoccus sp.]